MDAWRYGRWFNLAAWISIVFVPLPCSAQTFEHRRGESPVDNPLKGLVPYARPTPDRFPHSMEFSYLALSQLVIGDGKYQWQAMEELLDDIASRGNQAIVRIFLEYPGKKEGIPQYLIDGGLKVHRYLNTNTAPFPPTEVVTPDYEDPNLRRCLVDFITEFGKRYDGDPRLAYITAGLLGTWGEWHTYPREELWASKEVQRAVLDAYTAHFHRTPVLLRYPAGSDHEHQAENASRPMGYHDDSFAWATLETKRREDGWFYMATLRAAGEDALHKWELHPIGGEIRPELWGKIFDDRSTWPREAQDFHECVSQTHVTWLMDTGMFREEPSDERRCTARQEVRRMGYDITITRAAFNRIEDRSGQWRLGIKFQNHGVAPFYADWNTELALLDRKRHSVWNQSIDAFSLWGIMPDMGPIERTAELDWKEVPPGRYRVLLRVINPLPQGKPVRFANEAQDQDMPGWLTLGTVELR